MLRKNLNPGDVQLFARSHHSQPTDWHAIRLNHGGQAIRYFSCYLFSGLRSTSVDELLAVPTISSCKSVLIGQDQYRCKEFGILCRSLADIQGVHLPSPNSPTVPVMARCFSS